MERTEICIACHKFASVRHIYIQIVMKSLKSIIQVLLPCILMSIVTLLMYSVLNELTYLYTKEL